MNGPMGCSSLTIEREEHIETMDAQNQKLQLSKLDTNGEPLLLEIRSWRGTAVLTHKLFVYIWDL
jgi:hypothetical protein